MCSIGGEIWGVKCQHMGKCCLAATQGGRLSADDLKYHGQLSEGLKVKTLHCVLCCAQLPIFSKASATRLVLLVDSFCSLRSSLEVYLIVLHKTSS